MGKKLDALLGRNFRTSKLGKKLEALLGRSFKTSKFRPLVKLAISRLAILKKQRQARLSIARSDVVQLLKRGHHEQALRRVEVVIKEQNMLDVFLMIDGYCFLLLQRINLIEQEELVCPDELKEAISSLLYASPRCGEIRELQEMHSFFTSRFGTEFVERAIELRGDFAVNSQIVQKLSTGQPSLENRLTVLKESASENGIDLQIEEPSPESTEEKLDREQNQKQPKEDSSVNSSGAEFGNNLRISPDEIEEVVSFSDTVIARREYRDVADAAQEASELAACAAAYARAAVELWRTESHNPDDQDSPGPWWKRVPDALEPMKSKVQTGEEKYSRGIENQSVGLGFEKIHRIQNCQSESENERIHRENKAENFKYSKKVAEFNRSVSTSSSYTENILKANTMSSDVVDKTKPLGKDIVFDESDDETGNEYSRVPLLRTHDMVLGMKPILFTKVVLSSEKSNTVRDEDRSEASDGELYHTSHNQFPLKSQAGLKVESGPGNSKAHLAEGSKMQMAQSSNIDNTGYGH